MRQRISTKRLCRAIYTIASISTLIVAIAYAMRIPHIVQQSRGEGSYILKSDGQPIGADNVVAFSPYDKLFQDISAQYGNHWCLMVAMSYVESRFKPYARSKRGAVGLMQIMPRTADIYGVSREELLDPRVNIQIGNRHYNYIERMLAIPDDTSMRDRISLVLAGYNGGVGRVFDAQRLTRLSGADPHVWANVAPNMLLLNKEEGYTNSVVRFGRFTGASKTVRYVDDVLSRYNDYLARSLNINYESTYPLKRR